MRSQVDRSVYFLGFGDLVGKKEHAAQCACWPGDAGLCLVCPLALTPHYSQFIMPGREWQKQISPQEGKIAWDIDFAFSCQSGAQKILGYKRETRI